MWPTFQAGRRVGLRRIGLRRVLELQRSILSQCTAEESARDAASGSHFS